VLGKEVRKGAGHRFNAGDREFWVVRGKHGWQIWELVIDEDPARVHVADLPGKRWVEYQWVASFREARTVERALQDLSDGEGLEDSPSI